MIDPTTAYVIGVIFIATIIRSSLGFGEALIAVPLLALCIPVAVATPLAVLVSVVVAAIIVAQDWRKIEAGSVTRLLLSSLFGIPFGLLLLKYANPHAVKLLLGVVITTFAVYSLAFKSKLHLEKDHMTWLLGSGFCAGVLGGAYGMNGPALVVYGSMRRWPPQKFRATLQGYFLPASLASLVCFGGIGLWTAQVNHYFLLSLPGTLVAVLIGRAINHRLRGDGFFRYVFVILILLGGTLVVQALRSWFEHS